MAGNGAEVKETLALKELINESFFNGDGTKIFSLNAANQFKFEDDRDLRFGTTNGTTIGTADTQKIGFWGATPVVQQVLATGAGATVDDVISLLQTLGLCKQS